MARHFTTADGINIETQLGYTYGPGSLDRMRNRPPRRRLPRRGGRPRQTIASAAINRARSPARS